MKIKSVLFFMCFFPFPNLNFNGVAYRNGVTHFDCGSCPECMAKRSSIWSLRAVYESREHAHNCMITLTYDSFKYDKFGNCLGENPVNPDLSVSKRDVQLFLKRLRKSFASQKIKYIFCAEYGSRTHRAHYHAILFNLKFPDLVPYKKSKRGNQIYMSHTLTRLWGHGICTVDCVNVGAAVARYCTKYCAKQRSDDTFMLFSQGIGLNGLLRDFNGREYIIDGRHYPVPRVVWQKYIMDKYSASFPSMDYRYVNRIHERFSDGSLGFVLNEREYASSCLARSLYRSVRDSDSVYRSYLEFWRNQSSIFDRLRSPVPQRIYSLNEGKYHFYKIRALECFSRRLLGVPVVAPNSGSIFFYEHWKFDHLPYLSCHNTASDTRKVFRTRSNLYFEFKSGVYRPFLRNNLKNFLKELDNVQLSML